MFRYIVIISAVGLSCCLACNSCKDKNCPDFLEYQLAYTTSAIQDTFHPGDTIWIDMNFADQMTDIQGNVENMFVDFNFRLELQCDRIDINPAQAKAISYMDLIPVVGEVVPQGSPVSGISYFEVLPIYKEHRYHFQSALIVKQAGTFVCGINPFADRINTFEITGNCDHLHLDINSKVNDGDSIANNFYLLKSSPVDAYRDMTLERFGQNVFSFIVIP